MKVKILWDHSLEERQRLGGVFGRRSLVEKVSQENGDSNSTSTSPIMPSPSQSSSSSLPGPPSYQAQSVEKVSVRSKASNMLKNKAFITGLCVGVLLLLIVAIILCLIFLWRRTRKKKREHELFNPQKPHNKTKTEGQHVPSKGQHSNGQSANRNSPSNEQKSKRNTPPHGQQATWGTPSNGRQGTSSNPSTGQQATWSNPSNIGQPSGPVSSEQWSAVPPPPPPPMMSTTEMSTSGFSTSSYHPVPPPHPNLSLGFNKSTFTYEDLSAATNGFAKTNLLGQGGFGYVHKGVLPNGKEIAVKSLKSGSGQGEREFQAEVEIISRVHHRHLVSLVGYCMSEQQRMLVYEFVPNGSLEHHLYGRGVAVMDFAKRLKIALGAAKGFAYLHEDCHPRIIHRDIKAANILLDDNFEAMVADFGLAKLSNDEFTHVSTRIMGTFGYLAPEYASSGKLTEKSDVYSYGIVLLELITGRRPVDIHSDGECLIDWARPILTRVTQGGSYEELVDPRLENHFNHQEMLRMVVCANACIRHSARRRPKMSQIVRALEGDVSLEDLNVVKHSELMGSGSDQDSSSNSEIARFMKTAFSSGLTNSDHVVTEDYGHTPSSSDDSAEFRLRAKRGPNQ